MTLISEKWIAYLHEKKEYVEEIKEGLYQTLYEYDLKQFSYDIEGGYRAPDTGLEDFSSTTFVFLTNQKGNVTIQIGPDFTPLVRLQHNTVAFADYYHLDVPKSNQLEHFFKAFGIRLLPR